ncbi:MAG: uncharacterized protein KVP18_005005 [Porospora cf. gigantea A]|nr:MAG: hypothetical protein KVP18_005005 [Porospora cf. gigantea A]
MIPYGQGAFFEGRLVNTNTVLQTLGAGYKVERTVENALKALKRHEADAVAVLEETAMQFKRLTCEGHARQIAPGVVEITEPFNEQLHGGLPPTSRSDLSKSHGEVIREMDLLLQQEQGTGAQAGKRLDKECTVNTVDDVIEKAHPDVCGPSKTEPKDRSEQTSLFKQRMLQKKGL